MDTRSLLSGMAIGAALALALDPDQGTRRRARIRDTVIRGTRRTAYVFDAAVRGMRNRARGVPDPTQRFRSDAIADAKLIERVRTRIGRASSHPHAIHVYAHDGEVTLTGPVLAGEVRGLLTAAASARGVHAVVNQLEPHDSPEGVPWPQEHRRLGGAGLGLWQAHRAPVARALVGAAALAAGGFALARARR